MRDKDTSIGALIGQLLNELSALLRAEIQLAKTEAEEKISQVKRAIAVFVVAFVFVFAAVVAMTSGTALAFQALGLDPVAAEFATAALALAIAGILGWIGAAWLKPKALAPDKTISELKRNRAAIMNATD